MAELAKTFLNEEETRKCVGCAFFDAGEGMCRVGLSNPDRGKVYKKGDLVDGKSANFPAGCPNGFTTK